MKKAEFVDNNTQASNPGNVKLKKWIWLWNNFEELEHIRNRVIILFVISIILMLIDLYLILIAIPIIFILFIYSIDDINEYLEYLEYVKEHFEYGNSLGGIVISEYPILVAVCTDMRKYEFGKSYPIIQVIEYNKKAKIGERIATVALYEGNVDDDLFHWTGCNPIPIDYATNNKDEIQAALNIYSYEYWEELNFGINQLKTPYKVGMYKIKTEDSGWE